MLLKSVTTLLPNTDQWRIFFGGGGVHGIWTPTHPYV